MLVFEKNPASDSNSTIYLLCQSVPKTLLYASFSACLFLLSLAEVSKSHSKNSKRSALFLSVSLLISTCLLNTILLHTAISFVCCSISSVLLVDFGSSQGPLFMSLHTTKKNNRPFNLSEKYIFLRCHHSLFEFGAHHATKCESGVAFFLLQRAKQCHICKF